MLTKIKRIIKFGFQGLSRNKGLGLQVIFIMAVAVGTLTWLLIFRDLSSFMLAEAEKKIDVSVYFKEEAPENEILLARQELLKISPGIKEADYISREAAREIFIERHKNDPLYLSALEEAGDNPFLASLNVKSESPALYGKVADFFSQSPLKEIVEKISYFENKAVIDKLFVLASKIKKAGMFLTVFLIVLVFFITFNTVKLTIFALREEISTMRLVGASNWFIRGPFLVQGALYGIISLIIVDLLFALCFVFFSADLQSWLLNFSLLGHFKNNFLVILAWQALFAIILGGLSSYFAVRKYLKA